MFVQTYPIVEIFHSVQGEAFHTGMPHVFIRFGNCNLRCEWCDTDFLTYTEMDLKDIVNESCNTIVIGLSSQEGNQQCRM